MGGLTNSPSLPPMPTLPQLEDPAAQETQARLQALERRRRGRTGTITTTDRGLIHQVDQAPRKKTLLGE